MKTIVNLRTVSKLTSPKYEEEKGHQTSNIMQEPQEQITITNVEDIIGLHNSPDSKEFSDDDT